MLANVQAILGDLRLGRLWRRTAAISALIVAAALAGDFLFNAILFPGAAPYTPIATLAIALMIAPPFVHALLLQTERVRDVQDSLAQERAARAAIEAAHSAKSRFLSIVSHELRTPLNAILGYAEIIEEEHCPAVGELQRDVLKISRAARHLLGIVDSLLEFSQIEARRIPLHRVEFDLAPVLDEVALLVRPLAERNGNALTVEVEGRMPACFTDRTKLRQCLTNLAENAARFTTGGRIVIVASSERRSGADWVSLEVRDTGIGISREALGRLFEAFEQADRGAARKFEGIGLGLAITKHLVEMLEGAVTVSSVEGQGSVFRLLLPARLEAGVEAQKAAA